MAAGIRVAFMSSARTWRGSTVSLTHIALGLRERGHHPRLLVGEDAVAESMRALGATAEVLPVRNTGPREWWALLGALRRHGTQVLVLDRPRDLRLAGYASLIHPMRLVYRYNVSRHRPPSDPSVRLAYRRTRLTVFTTDHVARHALARAPFMRRVPWRVIGSAVDTTMFHPDPAAASAFREAHGLGDGPFLLAVGALMPEKRYDVLLDALALLDDAPPLVVCGDGLERHALHERARELGVDVRWPGFLPPSALRGGYSAASLMLHACDVETFGLSVAEAMCCGAAIAAARGGGVPEVLGDAGVLVPPGEPDALAAAIRELLADPGRRAELGFRARARALDQFSPERLISRWESALDEVAGR